MYSSQKEDESQQRLSSVQTHAYVDAYQSKGICIHMGLYILDQLYQKQEQKYTTNVLWWFLCTLLKCVSK